MKIKDKKPYGEKHRVRRAKLQQQRERRLKQLDESRAKALAPFLQRMEENAWYRRIQALKPDDACEYFAYPEWRAALCVRQDQELITRWEVRDEQGRLLRAHYVRHPGDQEAWWGLGSHGEADHKFVQGFNVEVIA